MKKTLSILVVLMLVLGACSVAFAIEDKDIRIVGIGQQTGNVVFLPAEEGVKQAGIDLGIDATWQSPLRAEAELQNEIMNNLIELGVSGIAISCTTGDALQDVIDRAIEAGIQVSCFDVDSPESQRAFYAGTENYKAGYTCGEYMIELFKDSGLETVRVAQLEGIPGANDIEARKQGFADAIEGTNIEVVYSYPCQDNVDQAIQGIEDYTRAEGENIDAWYMAGGWPYVVDPSAMPEMSAWKLADPNRRVVTVDIFVETTPAFFEQGLLDIAVGQDFYQMGYQSVVNLYKLIKGEEIDAPYDEDIGGPFINTGVVVADVDNWEEVVK